MPKRTSTKDQKRLKERYGKLAESMEPYYDHLNLLPLAEMDDAAFAFIMKNVKGVNMLDLNETAIGNDSIRLLTQLEYVYELRAKGCPINNDCVENLQKLRFLRVLHVKSTRITIDGLLRLKDMPELRELMFSDDADDLEEKMQQLRQQLPGCSFTINSIPWQFGAGHDN